MAYTFSNTQGDRTITVNDNQLDQTSYSLTLLGKNVTNYGERIAENTIRQLENFASPNQPNPTVKLNGQLWYDKTGEHLRVYTGATEGFKELGFRPTLNATPPTSNIQSGEMYYDTTDRDKNLYIYNGSAWVNVVGVEYIQDTANAYLTAGVNLTKTYNDSSNTLTLDGKSDSAIRGLFSGGTGVTYTSGTGAIAIGQAVETTSNVTFNNVQVDGNHIITGNLTVNGTQTILNTETLTVDDNLIVLNNNATGSPSENAGIEIERGSATNVQLRWNESTDHWEITNNGSAYTKIAQDTGELAEGTNLYYTTARARAAISEASTNLAYNSTTGVLTYTQGNTDTVSEGSSNLYFTNGRADARVNLQTGNNLDLSAKSTTNLSEGTNLYYTNARVDARMVTQLLDEDNMASNSSSKAPTQQSIKAYVDTQFATKDELGELSGNTDDITEGSTNLFFTNARADARVNAVLPNTSSLSEGTNLYHTVARANTAIDARVTKTFVNALNIDAETTNKALVTAAGDVNQNLLLVFTGPDTGTNANAPLYKHSPVYYNPDIDTLNVTNVSGTSSSAKYADLAENYVADAEYEEGTVLVFGGEQEVTTSNTKSNPSIAGVVSMNPAYLMNSELQGDHIVAVALKGRVPVKVVGPVSKGDVLVHSETPGHAEAASDSMNVNGPSCIGIAITDVNAGVVEAMIK
tara:strand:- start:1341 stop:3416 length:2076 start_codon:yes stop_codon:yes gene_type:complete